MAESINVNSLADHHIWSTIKTLPATLPEPSFKVQVSSAGVAGAVSASDLHYVRGWGRRARAAVRGSRTLVDGFIKKELIPSW